MSSQTGGEIVAQMLSRFGADIIFSVSGNQILPIYDAVQDYDMRIIHTRHESAAAYAALATAEVRDQPGVVLVSAGPGFLAALPGVAAARSMELPLLFLSGDSPLGQPGHGAFQSLDQQRIAGTVCKASIVAHSLGELQSVLLRAWRIAGDGVPGPAHVSLPADILTSRANLDSFDVATDDDRSRYDQPEADTASTLDAIAERLETANRPLLIARPSASRFDSGMKLRQLASKLRIAPIVTESPRGLHDLKFQHVVPHLPESDCALVMGPADFSVDFLSESAIASDGDVLLIDDPSDPPSSRNVRIHLQVDPAIALSNLASRTAANKSIDNRWLRMWNQHGTTTAPQRHAGDGMHPLEIASIVRSQIHPHDILVLDGGEFCQWMRLGLASVPNLVLWNGKLGAIGGSIPMAIGLASASPGVKVVAILGDGAAGYHLSEFETAARYGLPITAIVGNDARWSAEWHMQARRYGANRVYQTELSGMPYDQATAGYGGDGIAPTTPETFRTALIESLNSPRSTCLNVPIQSIQSPAALE